MSAIAGIINFDKKPVDPGILERMRNILQPYGRDAQHIWKEPGAGLVRTLCRITPEDAMDQQPLKSPDGNLVLVFDGRIDNRCVFRRIRTPIPIIFGHPFQSIPDTYSNRKRTPIPKQNGHPQIGAKRR